MIVQEMVYQSWVCNNPDSTHGLNMWESELTEILDYASVCVLFVRIKYIYPLSLTCIVIMVTNISCG